MCCYKVKTIGNTIGRAILATRPSSTDEQQSGNHLKMENGPQTSRLDVYSDKKELPSFGDRNLHVDELAILDIDNCEIKITMPDANIFDTASRTSVAGKVKIPLSRRKLE